MSLTDHISKRFKTINCFASDAKKCIDVIEQILVSYDMASYREVMDGLEWLLELVVPGDNGVGPEELLQFMLDLYIGFSLADIHMKRIYILLSDGGYAKKVAYNMSSTYVMNMSENRNRVLGLYEKYISTSIADDNDIFNIAAERLNIPENIGCVRDFLMENAAVVNKFTTWLTSKALKYTSGPLKAKLLTLIQNQVNALFGSVRNNLSKFTGAQSVLAKYGLVPLSESLPLRDIFHICGKVYNDGLSDAENIKGVALVVIDKSSPHPIEFDLRGLCDMQYLVKNDLLHNPKSGLTKKILARYSTIKELPAGTGVALPLHVGSASDKWCVLETLNGVHYRVLGKVDGGCHLETAEIYGLLNGISTRADDYNREQGDEIIHKCIDTKLHPLATRYEEKLAKMVNGGEMAIINAFEAIYKSSKVEIISVANFEHLIRDNVSDILLKNMPQLMGRHSKSSSEYMVNYLIKMDEIKNDTTRNFSARIHELTKNSTVTSSDGLYNIYIDMVKSVINDMNKKEVWHAYDISLKQFIMDETQVTL